MSHRPNLLDKIYYWLTGSYTKKTEQIRQAEFERMQEEAAKIFKAAQEAKAKAKAKSKPKASVAKPKATPKATGKTSTSPSKKKPSK